MTQHYGAIQGLAALGPNVVISSFISPVRKSPWLHYGLHEGYLNEPVTDIDNLEVL